MFCYMCLTFFSQRKKSFVSHHLHSEFSPLVSFFLFLFIICVVCKTPSTTVMRIRLKFILIFISYSIIINP